MFSRPNSTIVHKTLLEFPVGFREVKDTVATPDPGGQMEPYYSFGD